MKTKLLFLFLFVSSLYKTYAQKTSTIDSLKIVLKSTNDLKKKLPVYDLLINKLSYTNPDSAVMLSEDYLKLATNQKDELHMTKAKTARGLSYFRKSDYKNAAVNFMETIKAFEKQGLKYDAAIALNNLAACYEHIESPEATIKNFKKAHDIFLEIKNVSWIGITASNLSNNYLLKLNDLTNAEKYAKIAIESAAKTGEITRQAEANIALGNVLFTNKKYAEASEAFGNVTKLVSATSYPLLFGVARVNQGSCLNEIAEYEAALKYTNEAKDIFLKQKSWMYSSICWQGLIEIYQRKKDYKAAFEAQKGLIASNDSLQVQQKRNEMIDALRKYESEKKEQENKLLSTQLASEKQTKLFTFIGIGLVSILAIVIGFALRKNRKKNTQLAHQNDLITQQKDKLTELNVEKNNLISIVSHDLRSPFNTIALWNQTLQENIGKSPQKVAEATEMIAKTANYGQQMINNILDIEKIEINTHKIDLKPVEVPALVVELVEDFAPAAKGKNIEIKTENQLPDNFKIISDYQLVRRAVENLISNALKFSHRDTSIIVGLSQENDKFKIKVKDFGIGIPENERHLIFGKYGKTSAIATEGEASTGLGLNIVKRICEELGGSVSFISEENIGSEFTIELSASH